MSERPSQRGFYAIAHGAGNNIPYLETALASGVDAIECDLWHAHGRLVLRHERKLPALPVVYDKWYMRFRFGELKLREVLERIRFQADVFLDIKSATPRSAESLLALYRENRGLMPRTLVSSKRWKVLDRLARIKSAHRLYYSVGERHGVGSLLRRAEKEPKPDGTSIRHNLLDRAVVGDLHASGLEVYAWTVNNVNRAEELLEMGVDGLISDDVRMLMTLRGA